MSDSRAGFLHDLAYDKNIPDFKGNTIKSWFREELPGFNEDQLAEVFGAVAHYMATGIEAFEGEGKIQFVLGIVAKSFAKLYTDHQSDMAVKKLLASFKED